MAVAVRAKSVANDDSRQLWRAIETGDLNELRKIFGSGVSINSTDENGVTPLLHAACYDRIDVIRTLIECSADVNAVRSDGFTPLLLAVFHGHRDVIQLLVESGADVTATSRFGTSAQMWAAARGFSNIADYLQQHVRESQIASVYPAVHESCPSNETSVQDSLTVPADADTSYFGVQPEPEPGANAVRTTEAEADERSTKSFGVKTLKDPPEIWDLVPENRSSFNPRGALLSRMMSLKPGAVVVVATILVATICLPTVLKLQRVAPGPAIGPVVTNGTPDSEAVISVERATTAEEPSSRQVASTPPAGGAEVIPESHTPSPPAGASPRTKPVGTHLQPTEEQKLTRLERLRGRERHADSVGVISSSEETADTAQGARAPGAVESNSSSNSVRKESASAKMPSPLTTNSHLINPPSASSGNKPKIIQWP